MTLHQLSDQWAVERCESLLSNLQDLCDEDTARRLASVSLAAVAAICAADCLGYDEEESRKLEYEATYPVRKHLNAKPCSAPSVDSTPAVAALAE